MAKSPSPPDRSKLHAREREPLIFHEAPSASCSTTTWRLSHVVVVAQSLAADARSSYRKLHQLEERRVSWVTADLAQELGSFDVEQPAVALRVGSHEPLERTVAVTAPGMDLGDLIRIGVRI